MNEQKIHYQKANEPSNNVSVQPQPIQQVIWTLQKIRKKNITRQEN